MTISVSPKQDEEEKRNILATTNENDINCSNNKSISNHSLLSASDNINAPTTNTPVPKNNKSIRGEHQKKKGLGGDVNRPERVCRPDTLPPQKGYSPNCDVQV